MMIENRKAVLKEKLIEGGTLPRKSRYSLDATSLKETEISMLSGIH